MAQRDQRPGEAMTILGLRIPEGQQLWFWSAGEAGHLLLARDYDEAYAKVLALRLSGIAAPSAEDVSNAQRWSARHDHLERVVAEYTGPAFAGEIPEVNDD